MGIWLLQKRLTASFTEDEARLMVAAIAALPPWHAAIGMTYALSALKPPPQSGTAR